MNIIHSLLPLRRKLRIAHETLRRHRRTKRIVIIDQQPQTRQHHRPQPRVLERLLLPHNHLHGRRDRHGDRVDDLVEDRARVGLAVLRRQVRVDEALPVRDVDGAHGREHGRAGHERREQVAAVVGFGRGGVGQHALVDVLDVLDYGRGGDGAAVEGGGEGEGEEEGGG